VLCRSELGDVGSGLFTGHDRPKIVGMAEAPKDDQQQHFQNLLLRELTSEGVLNHDTVVKVGEIMQAVQIKVEGPVSFLVSTTKQR
jgi:hypothetical protein